jgi:hypothetical protein
MWKILYFVVSDNICVYSKVYYKIIKPVVLGPLDQTSLCPWKSNVSLMLKYFGNFKTVLLSG